MTDKIVTLFALLARSLYVLDNRAGTKLLNAVTSFVYSGECDSNAEEDSVCGETCPICNDEFDPR